MPYVNPARGQVIQSVVIRADMSSSGERFVHSALSRFYPPSKNYAVMRSSVITSANSRHEPRRTNDLARWCSKDHARTVHCAASRSNNDIRGVFINAGGAH